jgi:hypothetical protein
MIIIDPARNRDISEYVSKYNIFYSPKRGFPTDVYLQLKRTENKALICFVGTEYKNYEGIARIIPEAQKQNKKVVVFYRTQKQKQIAERFSGVEVKRFTKKSLESLLNN